MLMMRMILNLARCYSKILVSLNTSFQIMYRCLRLHSYTFTVNLGLKVESEQNMYKLLEYEFFPSDRAKINLTDNGLQQNQLEHYERNRQKARAREHHDGWSLT